MTGDVQLLVDIDRLVSENCIDILPSANELNQAKTLALTDYSSLGSK